MLPPCSGALPYSFSASTGSSSGKSLPGFFFRLQAARANALPASRPRAIVRRFWLGLSTLSCLVSGASQFDAPVARAAGDGVIALDGLALTKAMRRQAVGYDAVVRDQRLANGVGAARGEVIVVPVAAHIVRVPFDDHASAVHLAYQAGDLFQRARGFRFQGVTIEIEVDPVHLDTAVTL